MAIQRLLNGDPSRNSKLYLVIGVISLVKAIAVRNDRDRFRRELMDAGLFLGVGIALRKYSQLKAQKRAEIESQIPNWAFEIAESEAARQGIRTLANRRLKGQSDTESTFSDRARGVMSGRY